LPQCAAAPRWCFCATLADCALDCADEALNV
jgi:hypothetical protein